MVRTRFSLLLCSLVTHISFSTPVLPTYWTSAFLGRFLEAIECQHSGYFYYNAESKHLRTDWMFGTDCSAKNGGDEWSGKVVINDADQRQIRNYHLPRNSSSEWTCNLIPSPFWWEPDYLQHGTIIGQQNITFYGLQPMVTNVYNNTGLFLAGSVLTHVEESTNKIRRMTVLQGPHEVSSLHIS